MNVATFRATCKDCGAHFDNPSLGSMAYGEFIARGDRGTVFAYLPTFGNPGWDKIDQVFKKVFPKQKQSAQTDCFQWVVGKCLDPIDGQELSIFSGTVCPNCHTTNVMAGDDVHTGTLDLPDATFSNFLALDEGAQEQRVRALCDQWLAGSTRR